LRSIRRAILVPLIPLTGLALGATAWGIHEAARRDLMAGFERSLLAAAQGLAAGVEVAVDGTPEFDPEGVELPELGRDDPDFFYRVMDGAGRTVAASKGAPKVSGVVSSSSPWFTSIPHGDRTFRAVHLRVERAPERDEEDVVAWLRANPDASLPPTESRTFWVVVGRSQAPVTRALARLRRRLLLGFTVLFAMLVVLPAWIVWRALGPLADLSRQASRIGPDEPEARLPEGGVAAEIRGLVVAFNRALDRLAGAYERQKRFTADAAHELRTPLAAIRAQCEVALRHPRDAADLKEALKAVHRRVLKLGTMVEDLLRLTRLGNGTGPGEVTPVDLGALAREVGEAHRPSARAKGVDLSVHAPRKVRIPGYAQLLEECVSNLVENAVRHTPQGGRVAVEIRAGPPPTVVVTDTGTGIPPEHLPRIFERFYRADPARSPRAGGAGLGLAIAREIARLHQGDIRVESEPGRGSRFEVMLPGTDNIPRVPPS